MKIVILNRVYMENQNLKAWNQENVELYVLNMQIYAWRIWGLIM